MSKSYKAQKEAFVSNHNGGSLWEINQVTLVAPAAVLLWSILQSRQKFFTPYTPLAYLIDFLLQCGAILFAVTLYASQPVVLNGLLILPALAIFFNDKPAEPKAAPKSKPEKEPAVDDEVDSLPVKPFITNYRGAMMIITCVCILAVDFNVFPRRFAKTEDWGTSLMDLGVGSFVFSAGVVSVRQQLKEEDDWVPRTSLFGRLGSSVRHSLPLAALGFIRLYSVKGLDYQEHVTEYGVHWNFFFTLALIPPFVAVCQSLFQLIPSFAIIGWVFVWIQQLLFTYSDLLKWVVTSERLDFVSQNKEGIVSFIGYLSIFLAGQGIGINILKRDQDPLAPQSETDEWMASVLGGEASVEAVKKKRRRFAILSLAKWSLIWCTLVYFTIGFYGPRLTPSRRLANIAYVEWVAAFNCVQLLLFCMIETLLFPNVYRAKDNVTEKARIQKATSKVLQAFNRNSLFIFLLANLGTGLVNMTLPTLAMSEVESMAVLVAYIGVLAAVAMWLDHMDITIKL